MMKLYDYFRSSASYRVRIALHLKEIEHELVEVHLVKDGGQQHQASFKATNPQGLVPCLVTDDGTLTQSMSILEYLEEKYPSPPLLPNDIKQRAYVRQLSHVICCDIHPLNNLRVLNYLKHELSVDEDKKMAWYHHWLKAGFSGFEALLEQHHLSGEFCYQDQVSLADICLIPQVYNAYRFECPMDDYPKIVSIYNKCMNVEAFNKTAP